MRRGVALKSPGKFCPPFQFREVPLWPPAAGFFKRLLRMHLETRFTRADQ